MRPLRRLVLSALVSVSVVGVVTACGINGRPLPPETPTEQALPERSPPRERPEVDLNAAPQGLSLPPTPPPVTFDAGT